MEKPGKSFETEYTILFIVSAMTSLSMICMWVSYRFCIRPTLRDADSSKPKTIKPIKLKGGEKTKSTHPFTPRGADIRKPIPL